jgi:hypothetical protein
MEERRAMKRLSLLPVEIFNYYYGMQVDRVVSGHPIPAEVEFHWKSGKDLALTQGNMPRSDYRVT